MTTYCLYCNKPITDPWPNQTRHKPCNRKHKAEVMRAYRVKLKGEEKVLEWEEGDRYKYKRYFAGVDYFLIHEFCEKHNLSYNEVCAVFNKARIDQEMKQKSLSDEQILDLLDEAGINLPSGIRCSYEIEIARVIEKALTPK